MSEDEARTREQEGRSAEAAEADGAKGDEGSAEAAEDGADGADGAARGDEGSAEAAPAEGKKPGRLQQLVVEYGAIALVVHLTLFGLTLMGFAIAISAGFESEGTGEETGVWVAAYIASQLTKPIRLPLVVVLTPVVAAVWHRVRGTTPPSKP